MSPEFVRYTPEIETIDPHIDELLAQIVAFWEKKGHESPTTEGTGRAVRGEHAKSFGLVKAEVEILADVPSAHSQGIYAEPGRQPPPHGPAPPPARCRRRPRRRRSDAPHRGPPAAATSHRPPAATNAWAADTAPRTAASTGAPWASSAATRPANASPAPHGSPSVTRWAGT